MREEVVRSLPRHLEPLPAPPSLAARSPDALRLGQRREGIGKPRPEIRVEPAVEPLQIDAEHLPKHLLRGPPAGVAAQHGENGPEAVALFEIREHQRGLVIGMHHLFRIVRPHESSIELAHRSETILTQGHEETRGHVLAPSLPGAPFLVHGQSLGQPARYPVIRHPEMNRVRQLVPEGRAPVELAHVERRR